MSKKDYKQGISDAMAAYEAFGEKQEAAIRHVGAEIERTAGKVDQLGGKIGEITDYITDKEKAALYKLNLPLTSPIWMTQKSVSCWRYCTSFRRTRTR